MNKIFDRLYCGAFEDVDIYLAEEDGITCVLTLCEKAPEPVPGLLMLHAPITDEVCLPAPMWSELTMTVAKHLRAGHRLLVHCRLGKSRAPSLCAAHLMAMGYDPETALATIQAAREIADPHPETWRGVLQWWDYMRQGR